LIFLFLVVGIIGKYWKSLMLKKVLFMLVKPTYVNAKDVDNPADLIVINYEYTTT
jgi:hypothetical protein